MIINLIENLDDPQPNCIYQVYIYIYIYTVEGKGGEETKALTFTWKRLKEKNAHSCHFDPRFAVYTKTSPRYHMLPQPHL